MISSEPEEYARREFLRLPSLLAAASTCSSVLAQRIGKVCAQKKFCCLAAPFFVGPALIDALLADGHTVTLFNRGVTNADWL